MSKFKLLRNWNGHYLGEEVTVHDQLDARMIRHNIGVMVNGVKAIEVAPENKAITKAPKNKRKNV